MHAADKQVDKQRVIPVVKHSYFQLYVGHGVVATFPCTEIFWPDNTPQEDIDAFHEEEKQRTILQTTPDSLKIIPDALKNALEKEHETNKRPEDLSPEETAKFLASLSLDKADGKKS